MKIAVRVLLLTTSMMVAMELHGANECSGPKPRISVDTGYPADRAVCDQGLPLHRCVCSQGTCTWEYNAERRICNERVDRGDLQPLSGLLPFRFREIADNVSVTRGCAALPRPPAAADVQSQCAAMEQHQCQCQSADYNCEWKDNSQFLSCNRRWKVDAAKASVSTAEIQSRCLFRWDDSYNPHSGGLEIRPDYQAGKVTWKRLEHCIRLRVNGPVDIEGVAKDFVDRCVDHGINNQKNRYLVQALGALAADVWGGGGGRWSTANVLDYVKAVADDTIGCLTSSDRIADHFKRSLEQKFNASVKEETQWIYWDM
jgi:hypothetical protein